MCMTPLLYDILDSETINVIGNFFGDSVVNMVHTQKQTGCDAYDCGLFAVGNAAMKRNPTRVKFRHTLYNKTSPHKMF